MDQNVGLENGDREAIQRLIQYFLRCPFSQARMIDNAEVTGAKGFIQVVYDPGK